MLVFFPRAARAQRLDKDKRKARAMAGLESGVEQTKASDRHGREKRKSVALAAHVNRQLYASIFALYQPVDGGTRQCLVLKRLAIGSAP